MSKKLICLISIFLLPGLAGNVLAINYTDDGADHLWKNASNWIAEGAPAVPDYNQLTGDVQWARMAEDDTICIIDETHVGDDIANALGAYVGQGGGDNEWYMTGGILELQYLNVGRGDSDSSSKGYFKLTDGLIMTDHFNVPVQFNIPTGGIPGQVISGHADLHGGDLHIFSYFDIGDRQPDIEGGGVGTVDIANDCTMYWYSWVGDHRADVNNYVENGWFTAYDDKGYVVREVMEITPWYPDGPNVVTVITGILTYPQPRDGMPRVELDEDLRWADDPEPTDPNRYDVYMCASDDANNLALVSPDQADTYYEPGTLIVASDYCWKIVRKKDAQTFDGPVWIFRTIEPKATLVSPADGEQDVAPSAIVEWTPGPQATEHDVYFDANEVLVTTGDPLVDKGRQSETTYNPDPDMDWATTYFVRIDEVIGTTAYTGDVWRFSTWPLKARLVNPAPDGATDVALSVVLEWIPVPADTPGIDFSKLYFSDIHYEVNTRQPEADKGTQAGTTFDPDPDLDWSKTYYWCVDANSYSGDPNYLGDLWTFQTHVLTCEIGPAQGDTNGDCIVDVNDLKAVTGKWLECGFESQFCP